MNDPYSAIDAALISMRRLWAHPRTYRDPDIGLVDMSTVLVCGAVAASPAEVTVADVAVGLDVTHSTASRLIGRAEQAGAVIRTPSTHDGRGRTVGLTPAGAHLHETASGFRLEYLATLIGQWSGNDRERFAELLSRFADAARAQPPGSDAAATSTVGPTHRRSEVPAGSDQQPSEDRPTKGPT